MITYQNSQGRPEHILLREDAEEVLSLMNPSHPDYLQLKAALENELHNHPA